MQIFDHCQATVVQIHKKHQDICSGLCCGLGSFFPLSADVFLSWKTPPSHFRSFSAPAISFVHIFLGRDHKSPVWISQCPCCWKTTNRSHSGCCAACLLSAVSALNCFVLDLAWWLYFLYGGFNLCLSLSLCTGNVVFVYTEKRCG